METNQPLYDAIKMAGGQSALARAIGVTQQRIAYWLHDAKAGVPAEFVVPIEEATDVSRHRLRPDIFGTNSEVAA